MTEHRISGLTESIVSSNGGLPGHPDTRLR